jgi:site-specific recombinase XerD
MFVHFPLDSRCVKMGDSNSDSDRDMFLTQVNTNHNLAYHTDSAIDDALEMQDEVVERNTIAENYTVQCSDISDIETENADEHVARSSMDTKSSRFDEPKDDEEIGNLQRKR